MAKSRLRLVTPSTVLRTVMPRRPPNRDLRTREHLTEAEVERLMKATKDNRYGHRDATMILVAYRHGLRVSELVDLRWEQVDFRTASLHVRRVKKGTPSTHPIIGDELRALRRLQREQEPGSPFVFTSQRGAPFTTAGFARMLERAGAVAKLPFKAAHAQARLRLFAVTQRDLTPELRFGTCEKIMPGPEACARGKSRRSRLPGGFDAHRPIRTAVEGPIARPCGSSAVAL